MAQRVVSDPSEWGLMLRRGAIRRCPRCGGGSLFSGYWSMKDRCPSCGLRFIREEGYFTGVYLVNFGVALAVLFVLCMGLAIQMGSNPDLSLVPVLSVGLAIAVLLPIFFYPLARTIWAALDLAMTPMGEVEATEAAEAVAAGSQPTTF